MTIGTKDEMLGGEDQSAANGWIWRTDDGDRRSLSRAKRENERNIEIVRDITLNTMFQSKMDVESIGRCAMQRYKLAVTTSSVSWAASTWEARSRLQSQR